MVRFVLIPADPYCEIQALDGEPGREKREEEEKAADPGEISIKFHEYLEDVGRTGHSEEGGNGDSRGADEGEQEAGVDDCFRFFAYHFDGGSKEAFDGAGEAGKEAKRGKPTGRMDFKGLEQELRKVAREQSEHLNTGESDESARDIEMLCETVNPRIWSDLETVAKVGVLEVFNDGEECVSLYYDKASKNPLPVNDRVGDLLRDCCFSRKFLENPANILRGDVFFSRFKKKDCEGKSVWRRVDTDLKEFRSDACWCDKLRGENEKIIAEENRKWFENLPEEVGETGGKKGYMSWSQSEEEVELKVELKR